MSRGHGSMQQRILRQLSAGVETSVNVIQWQVAGQTSNLSDAVANSFGRALKVLKKEGAIRTVERDLTSFAEVIRFFPFRSRSLDVLTLRQRLLPLLERFKPERGGYGLAENERHVLATVNELRWRGEKRWRMISGEWELLEDELYTLLGKKAAPQRLIVDVITRGRDLFNEVSPISHHAPLRPMLRELTGAYRGTAEPPVLRKLMLFYAKYVPPAERVKARLLSKVLDIVHIARRGVDTIRTEAADFLLAADPTYIRGLPGHRDRSALFGRRGSWGDLDTKFSPLLNKLLTKEALQEFRFVIANGAHAMAPPAGTPARPGACVRSPRRAG